MRNSPSTADERIRRSNNRYSVLTVDRDIDIDKAIYIRSNKVSEPSIKIPVILHGRNHSAVAEALIDSGANSVPIGQRFAKEHQVTQDPLQRPIDLWNIDGTRNQKGYITHTATLSRPFPFSHLVIPFPARDLGLLGSRAQHGHVT